MGNTQCQNAANCSINYRSNDSFTVWFEGKNEAVITEIINTFHKPNFEYEIDCCPFTNHTYIYFNKSNKELKLWQ